jgi:hypothetical protein
MNSQIITKADIIILLHSNNTDNQLTAISEIRKNGDGDLLKQLLNLLLSAQDFQVVREILRCISDLKDPNMLHILIESIQNPLFSSKKREILHALWQTNFDCSAYCDYFISLIYTDSFEIGIEALTLLDVSCEYLSESIKSKYKNELMTYSNSTSDEQQLALINQAIALLQ